MRFTISWEKDIVEFAREHDNINSVYIGLLNKERDVIIFLMDDSLIGDFYMYDKIFEDKISKLVKANRYSTLVISEGTVKNKDILKKCIYERRKNGESQ